MATPEPERTRRASLTRSPDTLSPVWPDRMIRPLPRNRLRSKLSPEQVGSIVYPPNPPQSSPLFSFPYGTSEARDGIKAAQTNGHRHASPSHCDCGGHHFDHSEEEDGSYDHPTYRWSAEGATARNPNQAHANGKPQSKLPPAPASTVSSADGYESFENTSNKKKRKIPVSNNSHISQASLTHDLANMGISSPAGGDDGVDGTVGEMQNNHVGKANGLSGSGRGRYGRHGGRLDYNGRRVSPAGTAYQPAISSNRGGDYSGDGTKIGKDGEQGIISTAIANAAGQAPTTQAQGKENVSLLSQEADKSNTPNSQFTFTCESDTSSKIVWPLQGATQQGPPSKKNYYPIRQRPGDPVSTHQGTQTTPPLRNPHDPRMAAPAPPPPPPQNAQQPVNGQPPPPKPRRRRPSKEFAIAARQRRLTQEFTNYQHKPTKDSMWICEFCEYEDIWGRPPLALIRQYEVKDRAERQKAEERRRLLEKAKMKKNKGKNKGKGGKNANNPPPAAPGQEYDHGLDPNMPPDMQGDEYYDDEYDDGYDPVDPNDPAYTQGGYQPYAPHPDEPYHAGGHQHVAPPPAPAPRA